MTQVSEKENSIKTGERKAARSIMLLALARGPGRLHRIAQATTAINRDTKAMQRTARGKPTRGSSCLKMTGKMTAPRLEPIEAQPIARGRLVVKRVETIARAGMYEMPPPRPTQKPWARSIFGVTIVD